VRSGKPQALARSFVVTPPNKPWKLKPASRENVLVLDFAHSTNQVFIKQGPAIFLSETAAYAGKLDKLAVFIRANKKRFERPASRR